MTRNVVFYEDSAALGHDLALDHSRHDRVAREVAPGEELVFLDAIFGMSYAILVHLTFLHKKHRLPVRQKLFDFFFVHLVRV